MIHVHFIEKFFLVLRLQLISTGFFLFLTFKKILTQKLKNKIWVAYSMHWNIIVPRFGKCIWCVNHQFSDNGHFIYSFDGVYSLFGRMHEMEGKGRCEKGQLWLKFSIILRSLPLPSISFFFPLILSLLMNQTKWWKDHFLFITRSKITNIYSILTLFYGLVVLKA